MRGTPLVIGVSVLLSVAVALPSSSAATSSAAGWGKAIQLPGTAALNSGGDSEVSSLSCGAVGTCAAGGFYISDSTHSQAFVAAEKKGVWTPAVAVPGTAGLNTGGNARVVSVSCGAAGECAGGGWYTDGAGHDQALVVSQKKGVWGTAVEVPGTAALNKGDAQVGAVSCGAAGDCAAGGDYTDGAGHRQVFVVSEKKGVWGTAVEVPGTAALNKGDAQVGAVSCGAAGDCAAGGNYVDGVSRLQPFVVSEKNGAWGAAIAVPGTATLNSGGIGQLSAISCAAAGACTAGGYYYASDRFEAFVVTEKKGVWAAAAQVPGTGALNHGGNADIRALSCRAPGECVAGGYYRDGSSHYQAFLVTEKKGAWAKAVEVPGTAKLNRNYAAVASVSCGAVGDCTAGGVYTGPSNHHEAFVVSESGGRWSNAIKVPGTAALNVGGLGTLSAVSCRAPGQCDAGGSYADGSIGVQAFVVHRASPCLVPHLVGKTLGAAKKALSDAYCRVGKVTQLRSKTKKGRVVAQHPGPGKTLKTGSKVALTVSKGS